MAYKQDPKTILTGNQDPIVEQTNIALAAANGGIFTYETTKDVYVTAVRQQFNTTRVTSIVNQAAGSNGEIQFYQAGKFASDKDFRYDANSDTLSVGNLFTSKLSLLTPSNISIGGGTSGMILSTNGLGDLSWITEDAANIIFTPVSGVSSTNVQGAISELDTKKLALSGGTMTGVLTLSGAPTADADAATKLYVDTFVPNFANFAGNVTVAAQPNITSVGPLTSLNVVGDANAGNIGATGGIFTYVTGDGGNLANIQGANVTGEVANANYAAYAGNVTIAAQANITSVGPLTSLVVTGDTTVGGNLTVNGTTTTVNTITLDVTDINVTIAKDATTPAAADGAGLTVAGAGATMTYTSGNDSWNFNKTIIGNISNADFANFAGNVTVAAQPNITSVGPLTGLTVAGVSTLGPVTNVNITGGAGGQFLQTDGGGGLTWATVVASTVTTVPAGNLAATDVQAALNELDTEKADLVSPTLTGVPSAPTAALGTNTTQLATTQFVLAEIASSVPAASETVAGKVELATAAEVAAGTDTTLVVTPAGLKPLLDDKSTGAASSTDNAVVRFDGVTGKLIKDGVVIISDTGDVTGVSTLTTTGALTVGGVSTLGPVTNVNITGGAGGQFLQTDGGGGLTWATVSSAASTLTTVPAGNLVATNVQDALNELDTEKLNISGGTMTGDLTLVADPTVALGAATKQYVDTRAPIASPTFTGVPDAPTAALGTNTTQLATTAFVLAEIASSVPAASETVAGKVELATLAEVAAGTDTTLVVTPAGLKPLLDDKSTGAASSTDNAVVRFDGVTGKIIQDGVVIISDTGDVTGVSTLATTGALTVGGVSTLGPVGNVTITGGTAGQVLSTNGAGSLTWATVSAGGPATAASVTSVPAGNLVATDVQAALNELDTEKATLASPTLTGVPAAPTAAVGTNTTQLATTAFVLAEIASSVPAASETVAGKVELATAAEVLAGTDTTRAVTAAGLKPLLDDKSTGAASSTDNAVVRFDGVTGKLIKDGVVIISDTGDVTGVVGLTVSGVSTLGPVTNVKITGGTNGQVLTTDGTGTLAWATVSGGGGGGDVVGSSTAVTDNALVRYDTSTGKLIKNSSIVVTDGGDVTGVAGLTTTGALTVGGVSTLGPVTNVKITGGTNGQVLTTDGTGTLAWSTVSAGGPASAASVTTVPAGNLVATNVQAALNELDTEKLNISGGTVTGALTINGVSTLGPVTNVKITGGTNGQVLTTDGTGTLSWATVSGGGGGGDVAGPASSTDNAVVRYDATTGKIIQNSLVIIGDGGEVSGVTTLTTSTSVQTPSLTTGDAATAGTITGTWTLTAGSTLNATYADLAEKYTSDKDYPPGTLLMIGGDKEVTLATQSGKWNLAGVVTSDPAYVLNSTLLNSACIALVGRVPCLVTGNISKGDMLTISDIDGVATTSATREWGTIIGRALEDYNSPNVGTIEIKVDRA
jgi:hypothetical protein